MIPIFTSEYSIGKSILSLEDDKELDESKLVSIVSIAKKHELKDVYLVDESMSGFVKAYQNLSKHGINLRFGYKVLFVPTLRIKPKKE